MDGSDHNGSQTRECLNPGQVRKESEEDYEEVIWGAMIDVENLCQGTEELTGLAVTQAQAAKSPIGLRDKRKEPTVQQNQNITRDDQPAFSYKSKAADPEAIQWMFQWILDVAVPNVTVNDLATLSGDLRKELVDYTHTQKIPKTTRTQTTAALTKPLSPNYSTPLCKITVTLAGKGTEVGLLDEGSEIVVVRKHLWEEIGFEVNPAVRMVMQTTNGGKEEMSGCAELLEVTVDGLQTWTHAFVVPQALYQLLLG